MRYSTMISAPLYLRVCDSGCWVAAAVSMVLSLSQFYFTQASPPGEKGGFRCFTSRPTRIDSGDIAPVADVIDTCLPVVGLCMIDAAVLGGEYLETFAFRSERFEELVRGGDRDDFVFLGVHDQEGHFDADRYLAQ